MTRKLFLASEVKYSLDDVDKFVGGLKGKKIAYIGTAANAENTFGEWKAESATLKLLISRQLSIEPLQLEDYRNSSVVADLRNKDILWFAGGIPAYLMYWIIRCELEKSLPELLEKCVYIGSSAGSMVCSQSLNMAALYPNELDHNGFYLPGLGFLSFEIFPHYDEEKLPMLKDVWKNEYGDLYLLKNGEAITIVGDKVEILGEKRILRKGELII